MKLKYLWKGAWHYIDLSLNTVPQFKLWEARGKTSPLLRFIGCKLNGVDVYEGDIIYYEDEHIYDYVEWADWKLGFWGKNNDIENIDGELNDGKIIGNIHKDNYEKMCYDNCAN